MHYSDWPLQEAIAHFNRVYPEEGCGFFVEKSHKVVFVPATNVAKEKTEHFKIYPFDYVKASDEGEIICVVHSHTQKDSVPSEHDTEAFGNGNCDWMIIGIYPSKTPDISYLSKTPTKPVLYCREFKWMERDCYSFVRDWYVQERDILLLDFYRKWEFWKDGEEIYLDNFKRAGFNRYVELKDLQVGDVVLLRIAGKITGHAAVYIGDNMIAHHLKGSLSKKEFLSDYYIKRITKIIRYGE